jgi:uncharacterized membrane protein
MNPMSERSRFLLATVCGLVLAAGVHIIIVLAAPRFAESDAFNRLRHTLTMEEAEIISAPSGGPTWLPRPDPAVAVAACAFDLDDGPVRVSAKPGGLFESLSFHSRGGSVFYALTDRAAVRGELELVVLTARQLDEALAEEDEEDPSRDVRIVSNRREGFAIVRVAAPFPSQRAQAEAAAKSVTCVIDGDDEETPPR